MINKFTYSLPFGKAIKVGDEVKLGDKILSQDGELLIVKGINFFDGQVFVKWESRFAITAIDLASVGIIASKRFKYIIKDAGVQYKSINNLLIGAGLAMEATGGKRLEIHYVNDERISFTCDSDNFISYLRSHIQGFGLTVE
jgi:hypothetical protein